jgi:hypothetical protein
MIARQVLLPAWPITLLVAVLCLALTWRMKRRDQLRARTVVLAGCMTVVPFLTMIWATLREHTNEMWAGQVPGWGEWEVGVLHGLAMVAVVATALAIWMSRGNRVLVAVWASVVLWWSALAWFVGGMSITGDWI